MIIFEQHYSIHLLITTKQQTCSTTSKIEYFIGDSFDNNNKIYNEYNDYCRVKEGIDHSWSVGTDTRQISLLDPGWQSPQAMLEMLNDDVKRRFYILDADMEVN